MIRLTPVSGRDGKVVAHYENQCTVILVRDSLYLYRKDAEEPLRLWGSGISDVACFGPGGDEFCSVRFNWACVWNFRNMGPYIYDSSNELNPMIRFCLALESKPTAVAIVEPFIVVGTEKGNVIYYAKDNEGYIVHRAQALQQPVRRIDVLGDEILISGANTTVRMFMRKHEPVTTS